MPFTFSHPAAILPITALPQRFYSLTGLIVGSIVPDFEYFIRMNVRSTYSHTVAGIFWFDLPVGLIAAFIFHDLVRNPLFNNMPVFQRRLLPFTQFNWNAYFKRNWLVVMICILVGAGTHVLWDSFTHKNNFFPVLNTVYDFGGDPMTIFEIFQRVSSVAGAALLLYAFYTLPPEFGSPRKVQIGFWIWFILIAAATISARALIGPGIQTLQHFAVVGISACFIALIAVSALYRHHYQAI